MKQQTDDETELRQYLLGELPREARAEVEERLFLDGDYFRRLQAATDDLIDDYVYEELSAADRGRFETYFLSQPGHREDLKIARALQQYISAEAGSEPAETASAAAADLPRARPAPGVLFFPRLRALNPLARLSLAAAALIIVAVGIWLVIKAARSREQAPPMRVQQPAPATPRQEEMTTNGQPDLAPTIEPERRADKKNQEPAPEETRVENRKEQEAPRHPGPPPPSEGTTGTTLAVLLMPGSGVRGGGEGNKVALTPETRYVTLRMPLPFEVGDYRDYRASLQSGGRAILTRPGLKPAAAEGVNIISLTARASLLLHGKNYQIKLSGVTAAGEARDVATYTFRVEGQ